MTDKDPKDMTASEQLRWAANGEPYNGIDENIWTCPTGKIKALAEAVTGEWPRDNEIFSIVADKIDAELAQARELSLRRGAELWAKANGWPDFREGEDFGAWLDRCALKLPCDKDGEPWSMGDRVIPGNRSESTVTGYDFDGNEWFLKYRWCGIDSYANEFATSCKRPAPEALGADGLPIVAGETVHPIYGAWFGIPLEVIGIEQPASVKVSLPSGKGWTHFQADCLTHTPPDTQQKIDDDATMPPAEYCAVRSIDLGDDPDREAATTTMVRDLLRRQRELDKRTGGE